MREPESEYVSEQVCVCVCVCVCGFCGNRVLLPSEHKYFLVVGCGLKEQGVVVGS